ncbi:MAG TPA: AbrB/MazE/SpoVT family DNA-binding domain-containing protein [Ignavibacteria bacterium]|mgnify:CR=1 FL=1|nr:AbrB/MazE/SpoVT family DNA-binding domain-containing protein [Ignavibacteria bacterium]
MNTTIVTTKGQIVIPAEIRKKYGIEVGTKIRFDVEDGEIKLIPITEEVIKNNIGMLKSKGKLLKVLLKEKEIEREL